MKKYIAASWNGRFTANCILENSTIIPSRKEALHLARYLYTDDTYDSGYRDMDEAAEHLNFDLLYQKLLDWESFVLKYLRIMGFLVLINSNSWIFGKMSLNWWNRQDISGSYLPTD